MLFSVREIAISGRLGTKLFPVLLAETQAQKVRGLQGPPLRRALGMLFAWGRNGRRVMHGRGIAEDLDVLFFERRGFLLGGRRLVSGQRVGVGGRATYVLEVPVRYHLPQRMGMQVGRTRMALTDGLAGVSAVER